MESTTVTEAPIDDERVSEKPRNNSPTTSETTEHTVTSRGVEIPRVNSEVDVVETTFWVEANISLIPVISAGFTILETILTEPSRISVIPNIILPLTIDSTFLELLRTVSSPRVIAALATEAFITLEARTSTIPTENKAAVVELQLIEL